MFIIYKYSLNAIFLKRGIKPTPLNYIIKIANMIPIVKIPTEEDISSQHYLNISLKCSGFWIGELREEMIL